LSFYRFLFFFSPHLASAGTEHNLSGWAWSDNIGWISFNSTNTNDATDYGVNENPDGTLVGYAWSSNIGWIQFGGLSGFPNGSGTQQKNAQVNGNNLQAGRKPFLQTGMVGTVGFRFLVLNTESILPELISSATAGVQTSSVG